MVNAKSDTVLYGKETPKKGPREFRKKQKWAAPRAKRGWPACWLQEPAARASRAAQPVCGVFLELFPYDAVEELWLQHAPLDRRPLRLFRTHRFGLSTSLEMRTVGGSSIRSGTVARPPKFFGFCVF